MYKVLNMCNLFLYWCLIVSEDDKMPRRTISLSIKDDGMLKTLSEKEHRSCSQQVSFMMEFYIKYKGKVDVS